MTVRALPPELVEFDTSALIVRAYERYSVSYADWRAAYSLFPTQYDAVFEVRHG